MERTSLCWLGVSGLPSAKIFLHLSMDFCFVHIEVLLGMGSGGKGEAVPVTMNGEGSCSR